MAMLILISVGFGCQSLSLSFVFGRGFLVVVSDFEFRRKGWGDRREIGAGVVRSLASSWATSRQGGSMAAGQRISLVEKRDNEEERPSETEERVGNGNNGMEEKKNKRK